MEPIFATKEIVNLSLNLLFYFIIGSFGAFVKDLYGTLTKKDEHIRLGKIFVGATCAMFIGMFLQEYFTLKITTIVPLTFLLGVLGFEIFGNITSINKLKKFTLLLIEFKRFSTQKLAESAIVEDVPEEEVKTEEKPNADKINNTKGSTSAKDPPEENDVETGESQNK